MRVATVSLLVAAVLAAAAATATAQPDEVNRAASELPPTLFEPLPEGVPAATPSTGEEGGGEAPLVVSAVLLAAAAAGGFYLGSARRTRRS